MIRVGTSGFNFPEWVGSFYPREAKVGPAQLAFYAQHLDTVEINYTFRHHPTSETLKKWRDTVPPGFAFTLKAHQTITHWKRLIDAGEALRTFADRALELEEALGAVLFQLPPNMKADVERLGTFCAAMSPEIARRAAFEFRHQSWFDTLVYDSLRHAGCGLVLAETDDTDTVGEPTAPLAYVRLRREDYSDAQLQEWAARLRAMEAVGHDVYCYLKHDDTAPRLALRLRELLT